MQILDFLLVLLYKHLKIILKNEVSFKIYILKFQKRRV